MLEIISVAIFIVWFIFSDHKITILTILLFGMIVAAIIEYYKAQNIKREKKLKKLKPLFGNLFVDEAGERYKFTENGLKKIDGDFVSYGFDTSADMIEKNKVKKIDSTGKLIGDVLKETYQKKSAEIAECIKRHLNLDLKSSSIARHKMYMTYYDVASNSFKVIDEWKKSEKKIFDCVIKEEINTVADIYCGGLIDGLKKHDPHKDYEIDIVYEDIDDIVEKKYQTELDMFKEEFYEKRNNLKQIVKQHAKTLLRKRKQMIVVDDYGVEYREKWDKEKEYFLANVAEINLNELIDLGIFIDTVEDTECSDELEVGLSDASLVIADYEIYFLSYIDEILSNSFSESDNAYNESMSGHDYEHFCAQLLEKEGWEAKVTKGSGDQGVDIVATKSDLVLAIQCKKYSKPVGNKAVQEVYAARQYIGADAAAVISNNSYTKSAQELARANDVLLLHHDQIEKIFELLTPIIGQKI